MKYKVDYGLMANAVNRFKEADRAMTGFAQRLEAIRNQLGQITQIQDFRANIHERTKAAIIIAEAIRNSGVCLDTIWREYYEAEKRVNIITIIIDWFKGLFGKKKPKREPGGGCAQPKPIPIPIPIPIPVPPPKPKPKPKPQPQPAPKPAPPPQPKPPPGNLTAEERAADLRMYNESHALLRNYENRWRAAKTNAEKMALLNSFYADMQRIMGTSGNPEISFMTLGPSVAGQFMTSQKTIAISQEYLSRSNSIILLKVLMHEVRHLYQAEAAGFYRDKPYNHTVSPERSQIWRDNYRNYIPMFPDTNAYRNQPIEADARWFSNGV